MRFCDSIFGRLLKPISRGQLASTVERNAGNAYDKVFKSWDHMVALVFAQLAGVDSLRALEAIWNANSHHHYHLGVGKLARSTLADANARRPVAIFAETFERLSGLADRTLKREGAEMLRLIDATPMKRIGAPEEIAALVLFLLSDESAFTTGQTMISDGGRVMRP